MPHKFMGIETKNQKQLSHLVNTLMMAKIHKGEPVNLKQVVNKEKVVRGKYNREEDKLRPLIIKELRRLHWKVWRVEPSFSGKFGLGDLYCINVFVKLAGWVECKTPSGVLSPDQLEFQQLCKDCGVNYWVVRSVEECKKIA